MTPCVTGNIPFEERLRLLAVCGRGSRRVKEDWRSKWWGKRVTLVKRLKVLRIGLRNWWMVVLGPLSLAQVPLLKRPKMLEVLPLPLHIFKRSYMAPTPIVSNISSVVFCPLAPTAHTHQMSDRARYAGYLAGTSNWQASRPGSEWHLSGLLNNCTLMVEWQPESPPFPLTVLSGYSFEHCEDRADIELADIEPLSPALPPPLSVSISISLSLSLSFSPLPSRGHI